jgi:hypothetical protein
MCDETLAASETGTPTRGRSACERCTTLRDEIYHLRQSLAVREAEMNTTRSLLGDMTDLPVCARMCAVTCELTHRRYTPSWAHYVLLVNKTASTLKTSKTNEIN